VNIEEHTSDDAQTDDFALGTEVVDSDADPDDRNTAVVVKRHADPALDVHIDPLDASVADVNYDYPADDAVVSVAYADELDSALDVWESANPEALAEICDDHGVRTYDFPVSRLNQVSGE
jgi:hypothetical protein